MNYHIIPVTTFVQNCLLIWCQRTKLAALVDPGGNVEKIIDKISTFKVILTKILLTHGHIDHVGAALEIAKYYLNIPIIGPEKKDNVLLQFLSTQSHMFGFNGSYQSLTPNQWMNDNDTINVGDILLKVLHCPGHTPGHIVFFEEKSRLLISGDVIFKGGIGRTDLPYSNYYILMKSIKQKLFPLGNDVTFIPGHGPISTLGYEKLNNPLFFNLS